jgi:hypothetical protein
MLSQQPMFSRYRKVPHRNMQQLPQNDFGIANTFIETVAVRNVLDWQDVDDFTDRVIPDMLFKISAYPVTDLPLVPFLYVDSRQSSVCVQVLAGNLLLHQLLHLYQLFQFFQFLFWLSTFKWVCFWVFEHKVIN